jgi:hypothetical protein
MIVIFSSPAFSLVRYADDPSLCNRPQMLPVQRFSVPPCVIYQFLLAYPTYSAIPHISGSVSANANAENQN